MSEMIEKVARAIYISQFGDDEHTEAMAACSTCIGAARAAIEAMREPTTEMLEAPTIVMDEPWDIKTGWQQMITAALK